MITEKPDGFVDLIDFFNESEPKFDPIAVINMAAGLKELHNLGYAHGDVKPENILYNPLTHAIRFIDFGYSCNGNEYICVKGGTKLYNPPSIMIQRQPWK